MKFDFRRLVELIWLALAAVCTVEFYYNYSAEGMNQQSIILLGGLTVSLFMYYFRRRGRKAFQNRDKK